MSGQQVSVLLRECLERARSGPTGDTCLRMRRESFPEELNTLLQEAKDRKWPFVEEKWQYKQSVTPEDKINSSDLVRRNLTQLLLFLRDSLCAGEPHWAGACVFLLDRLLYWMDGSPLLLKITKALHRRYPDVPIAPQVVIRQARVYLNTGKLQKAEFILSSLIRNNASTGCWTYERPADQTLVQAVSLQVRGQVLQTLGLWLEASELLWASLIGLYALPQPDKKGVGTSLGLLANVLSSMSERDFTALQSKPHVQLGILGEKRHRLLAAARAAKMAAVFSQYGSLYVLTNVVAQGGCLLSYSFSRSCGTEAQQTYLSLAEEAFAIGLLTRDAGEAVDSKLELLTLLKAAHGLSRTRRWTSGSSQDVPNASLRRALSLFVCFCESSDAGLCAQVMEEIQQIRSLLKVERFPNSDPRSFIPDSYRSMELGPFLFTPEDFRTTLAVFEKHHECVCEAFEDRDRGRGANEAHSGCITAFQTDTEALQTRPTSPRPSHSSRCHSQVFQPESEAPPASASGSSSAGDSLGSFQVIDNNGSRESSVSPRSIPNTFRSHKPLQRQSHVMDEMSGAQRGAPMNPEGRASYRSSSSSSRSSWGRVSDQSSLETQEEDGNDPDLDSNTSGFRRGAHADSQRKEIGKRPKGRVSDQSSLETQEDGNDDPDQLGNDLRKHYSRLSRGARGGSKPVERDAHKQLSSRASSGSSSWGRVSDQSSLETQEEDGNDPDLDSNPSGFRRGAHADSQRQEIGKKPEGRVSDQSSLETQEDGNEDPDQLGKLRDSNPFRFRRGAQAYSQRKEIWRKPEGGVSPGSSWERVSDQSSLETQEDGDDPDQLGKLCDSNSSGFRRGAHADSQRTESEKKPDGGVSPGSSWERVSDQSLETQEDGDEDPDQLGHASDPHALKDWVSIQAKAEGGGSSSFSLCDGSGSDSSWENLNLDLNPGSSGVCVNEPSCSGCFQHCIMGSERVTERDLRPLLAGVCHRCLLERLPDTRLRPLETRRMDTAYDAVVLKYSRASGLWTGCESCVYIGKPMGVQGKQRRAVEIRYLHQEQLLSSYVGKEYLKAKGLHAHLEDVERQMTAQYYVTEFNKRLYSNNITTQIFFIPAEVLLVLEEDRIVTCLSAEPFMSGTFRKLTNNTRAKADGDEATKFGIAFGHFSYELSRRQEVVVDLQGWVTANGKGLTYLTDPQIHSLHKPRSSNFQQMGIDNFIRHQHGAECNEICRAAGLAPIS